MNLRAVAPNPLSEKNSTVLQDKIIDAWRKGIEVSYNGNVVIGFVRQENGDIEFIYKNELIVLTDENSAPVEIKWRTGAKKTAPSRVRRKKNP